MTLSSPVPAFATFISHHVEDVLAAAATGLLGVVAVAGGQAVVSGAAAEDVMSFAALARVVAGATEQVVAPPRPKSRSFPSCPLRGVRV